MTLEEEVVQLRAQAKIHELQRYLLWHDLAWYGTDHENPPHSLSECSKHPHRAVLCLLISDTFAWGYADAERVEDHELQEVVDAHQKWGWDGVVAWVSVKRGGDEPMREALKDVLKFNEARAELKSTKENRTACAQSAR